MNNYVYIYQGKLYLNITNKCSNRCTFCIRNDRQGLENHNLWLSKEPCFEDMVKALSEFDLKTYNEVTFCGFGEPVFNLETLIKTAQYLKSKDCKVKLNTNGQGNLINGKNIVPQLNGIIDVISISLNSSNSEKYQEICHSCYENSFDAILEFAVECKKYIAEVVMSKVDEGDTTENAACEKLCDKMGVKFRLRQKV